MAEEPVKKIWDAPEWLKRVMPGLRAGDPEPPQVSKPDTIKGISTREKLDRYIKDPTWKIRDKMHEWLGQEGPLTTDLLSAFKTPSAVEDLNPAALPPMGIGKLSKVGAARNADFFKNEIASNQLLRALFPNTIGNTIRMIEQHPQVAGHARGFGGINIPGTQARYGNIPIPKPRGTPANAPYDPAWRATLDEQIAKFWRRERNIGHPIFDAAIAHYGPNITDDQIDDVISPLLGTYEINVPQMENQHPFNIFKAWRHEFQHGLDDAKGKLAFDAPTDKSYWIHPDEVRAYSAEAGFTKDVGHYLPPYNRALANRRDNPIDPATGRPDV